MEGLKSSHEKVPIIIMISLVSIPIVLCIVIFQLLLSGSSVYYLRDTSPEAEVKVRECEDRYKYSINVEYHRCFDVNYPAGRCFSPITPIDGYEDLRLDNSSAVFIERGALCIKGVLW